MKRYWLSAALAVLLLGGSHGFAAEKTRTPAFGALEAMTPEAVQAKAQAWLKEVGKTDAASQERFAAIWAQKERTILDRLVDTFALGDAEAAKLMAEARDPATPAPDAGFVPRKKQKPRAEARGFRRAVTRPLRSDSSRQDAVRSTSSRY